MSFQELDDILGRLRALGNTRDLEVKIAAEMAPELQEAVGTTLAAGATPEGKAWTPTKKGKRAYVHAPSRIRTTANGNLVIMTLTGPEVFGNYGAKGAPVRRMIPDAGAEMPESVAAAMTRAAGRVFVRLTRG